jgi:hypothetical protein
MARPKTRKRALKPVKRKKLLFIPYPLLVFLLLCVGVYLFAWTFNAHADDVIVNAIVKGKPVVEPPAITNIQSGQIFNAVPIYVSGTCPDNAAYVKIFRNGIYSGSAICENGKFDPVVDLFVGKNVITAKPYNVTDDEGPESELLTVYYQPPHPQTNLQTGQPVPVGSTQKTEPLLLNTEFVYKGYFVGQEVQWPMEISGGTAPYALNVDWGDGQSSIISRKEYGKFFINHVYKQKSNSYKNQYIVKVQASDITGNYAYIQFFVIVNERSAAAVGAGSSIYSKGPPTLGGLHDWVWAAWPLYGALVMLVVAFKLGEHEELLLLKKKHHLKGA